MRDDVDHPPAETLDLCTVFDALADPGRLATVRAVAEAGESSCIDLQNHAGLAVSRATMSHHLRVLRLAGIVRMRAEGTRRMVSLREDDLESRFPGLLGVVLARTPHPA